MKTYDEILLMRMNDYIKEYQQQEGRSPSFRKIMHELKLDCIGKVQRYIKVLKDRGYIESDENGTISVDWRVMTSSSLNVPLVGTAPCGNPILAIENYEGCYKLPTALFGEQEHFMVRARGDSMVGAGIKDGDLITVRKQNFADYGQIVVALIDEEVTVKTFRPQKDCVILHPENERMKDIVVTECEILGVVDGYIHKF